MMNMEFKRKLTIPAELKKEYPVTAAMEADFMERDRELKAILSGRDDRIVLIVGPCSADREDSVMDYVTRLRELQERTRRVRQRQAEEKAHQRNKRMGKYGKKAGMKKD